MSTIFILPISGIDFVRYIAIYSKLSEINLKPDTIFSASGGCIASYVAMMSNFSSSIENWRFNPDLFIRKLTPISCRLLTLTMNGFLYRRSDITEYIQKEFAFQKIQDVEIISGYFEIIDKKNQITIDTNYTLRNSYLKPENLVNISNLVKINYSRDQRNNEPRSNYLKQILDESTETICKTSNIPLFLEPIGETKAIDFGIVSPSPVDFVKNISGRIIYFSPTNMSNIKEASIYSTYFKNLIIKDIAIMKQNFTHETKFEDAIDFKTFFDSHDDFFAVIFCDCEINLALESFTSEQFHNNMLACKEKIKFLVFH